MHTKQILLVLASSLGALYAETIEMFLNEKWQFLAILMVVLVDAILGISRAFMHNQFKTQKAFKGVFMLVAFWLILAMLLTIEKGFPYASFLSEMVLLPICVFQITSIIKNAHLMGLINGPLADKILKNIDSHKK